MPIQKYSHYLEVSPTFESVVDIDSDQRNPKLWQEYIVGEDMEELMEELCQSLCNEAPDARRAFWVHGSYGTGKSYAAIFVKHLLEEKPETIDAFLAASSRLSRFRTRFMKCRRDGDYLVIWRTGCTGIRSGEMLLLEAEAAVRKALIAKFGDDADLGGASLIEVVREKINDDAINWEHVLENSTLSDDYTSVEQVRSLVEAGDIDALKRVALVIRQNGWGLIDNLETFEKWIAEVIDANGLSKSGIFFIWDEFTEYVDHSDDHALLQQLSEFSKVKPFFMMFVVHRTEEMMDSMGKGVYQRIIGRFHSADFHISADAALDLIRQSFIIRPNMEEHWKDVRKQVVGGIRPCLAELLVSVDDRTAEQIDQLCPMHPMTIRLLSRVSESFAAAQRTLFRFMKDQTVQDQGFVGFINRYGPDDQACWLTPEWLWDYFFMRESDVRDRGSRAAEFIRHFEENVELVERDENTLRVFKIALLLMTIMSSTRSLGLYGNLRSQDGISATVECLERCLAGTMSKELIRDKLEILQDDKLLVLDKHGGVVRLMMPYKSVMGDEFEAKRKEYDREFTRYKMFGKDGDFSTKLEEKALYTEEPMTKRFKVAACCAETNSISNRLVEVEKELEKWPHKLGLLLVAVKDETQFLAVQDSLAKLAAEKDRRLVIALFREPFTDEKRNEWLDRLTRYGQAKEAAQTTAANQFKMQMDQIVNAWVEAATNAGRINVWNGKRAIKNLYGKAELRKTIELQVLQEIFPYGPECIVQMRTAYRGCTEPAALAGIQRATNNSQLHSVLTGLQAAELLKLSSIDELASQDGSRGAKAVAAVAKLVSERMRSGKASLSEIWEELQQPPFGYYDTIACGVLLGFVFSFYKDSKYSWIDSAQAPHVLAEATLKSMVQSLCKGRMTTDYLSAGTVVFQNFREYAKVIFSLTDAQVAVETECWRSIREGIIQSGTPLWALKYLADADYINPNLREATLRVVDLLHEYAMQEGERENIMSSVFQMMTGHGKVRVILQGALKDRERRAAAFRRFLFGASPELERIVNKLNLQPILLSDKIQTVMQGAIYTWTEDQVREKLPDVVQEYVYLDVLNGIVGVNRRSIEEIQRDLLNVLHAFRISQAELEKLELPWFDAMRILRRVAESKQSMSFEDKDRLSQEIQALKAHGREAMSALRDAKPLLAQLIERAGFEPTREELDSIYAGLREMDYSTSLIQFENALQRQITQISQARNRALLCSKWTMLTGEESVKSWCVAHAAPILWIVPREHRQAIATVRNVQQRIREYDDAVQTALRQLDEMDARLLTDDRRIEEALLDVVGAQYAEIWREQREVLLSRARQKLGADMSGWDAADLSALQSLLAEAQREKAKREKLDRAKRGVQRMEEAKLRGRVCDFLDRHPEFCDDLME